MPCPDKVTVHPLVLLSVVDHYNRVAKDTKKRVVGVLLGSVSKGEVDVSNSFAGVFLFGHHKSVLFVSLLRYELMATSMQFLSRRILKIQKYGSWTTATWRP